MNVPLPKKPKRRCPPFAARSAAEGRDGFHAHMALREQLIALEVLAEAAARHGAEFLGPPLDQLDGR